MAKTPSNPESDLPQTGKTERSIETFTGREPSAYQRIPFAQATTLADIPDDEIEDYFFMAPPNQGSLGLIFYDYVSDEGKPESAFYCVVNAQGMVVKKGEYKGNRYPTFAILLAKEMEKAIGGPEIDLATKAVETILKQIGNTDCSLWCVGVSHDPEGQFEKGERSPMWVAAKVPNHDLAQKVVAALQGRGMTTDVNGAHHQLSSDEPWFVYAYQIVQLR